MFDVVRSNPRVAQVILALITVPFALWGVEYYVRGSGQSEAVATVGGSKITQGEFQKALHEQQERLRPLLGGRADPAMLDNPQLRASVLDNLINERLLTVNAAKTHVGVTDAQLAAIITSQAPFQENGQFVPKRYEDYVASQGVSKEVFEAQLRQKLTIQQSLIAVGGGVMPGDGANAWLAAQLEEREVASAVLRPDQYAEKVKLPADAVKAYYEANRKQFELPAQAKVEYLVFSLDAMTKAEPVDAEALRKAVEEASASGAEQGKEARRKAEDLLAKVRKSPQSFAELAKANSQDPGSKGAGGDLGFFGRGMMVKPFEDAVFKMKVGDISGLVESDFGYHIITLTDVRKGAAGEERRASHILIAKPAGAKSLDALRAEIAAKLKQQAASAKYAEAAEGFANTVYEQPDSLKPAAEKYKLTVQKTDWLARGGQAPEPFKNEKLMTAIFSADAVTNRRNTEAVEVAPNTLVAARVVDYKAATVQPLEAVAEAIGKLLVRQEAVKLAAADGEAKLAELAKGGKLALTWDAPHFYSRGASGLPPDVSRAIFKAAADKLPAYAGVAIPGGYVLFRISQRKSATVGADDPRSQTLRQQYARLIAEEEVEAWLAALKQRYPVEINKAALEVKP